jgi:hypothetical protein
MRTQPTRPSRDLPKPAIVISPCLMPPCHVASPERRRPARAMDTRGPGTPGARAWAGPPPELATRASRLAYPIVVLPAPRLDPATALPCAVTTHRRRDVTFASRLGQCGLPSNTSWAHATHTHTVTHTGPTGPSRTGSGRHTRSVERPTSGGHLSGEAWVVPRGPVSTQRGQRRMESGLT